MLFTRECDYGIRVIRHLADGKLKQVSQICEAEGIPKQYCYKIMKKLEAAELLVSKRGRDGGYQLVKSLDAISLFEVVKAVDENIFIMHCLTGKKPCPKNPDDTPCGVHVELNRIQDVLNSELRRVTFKSILKPS